jgi:hypothetical protein
MMLTVCVSAWEKGSDSMLVHAGVGPIWRTVTPPNSALR